jgi:regulator of sirC expression with transglutaminase-like and TPR domain
MTEGLSPADRWRRVAAAPDERIDLAEAALLIAADEYPGLDIEENLARFDAMGATLRRRLRPDIGVTDSLLALNHYLFTELGFAADTDDYYDPRNSFLNEVLARRKGIPITLSVVYMEVGRRIGLVLHGVCFPGHFLVKCPLHGGVAILDPYAAGASLSLDDLRGRLAALAPGQPAPELTADMLAAAGNREILARMLRNLKGIYLRRREFAKALAAADRIVLLLPEAAEEHRDRAAIYAELECFRAALAGFRRYLEMKPGAEDAGAVRQKIAELAPLAARLN